MGIDLSAIVRRDPDSIAEADMGLEMRGQKIGKENVIGIGENDEFVAVATQSCQSATDVAQIAVEQQIVEAGIVTGVPSCNGDAVIGRAVVHDDALE